jgi:hypothetical protein
MYVEFDPCLQKKTAWTKPKAELSKDLLKGSCSQHFQASKITIQSPFSRSLLHQTHISPSQNSLVYAVYHAQSQHHNLTLRPEDI